MEDKPDLKTELKLVAIVPPEPLFSFIREEQQYIADTWGPRKALRVPPHLTLVPPISVTEAELIVLESILKDAAASHKTFTLRVNGYDAFMPKVIFIKPAYPKELHMLYTNIIDTVIARIPHVMNKYPDDTFHPHFTIAYRDLEPDMFKDIWKYFKNKKAKFSVQIHQISIFDKSDAGWIIGKQFNLKEK